VVWTAPPLADLIQSRLPDAYRANTRREFYQAVAEPCTAIFVDDARLPETGAVATTIPIIGVIGEGLPAAVRWLDDYPWVGHIISESMLADSRATIQLAAMLHTLSPPNGRLASPTSFLGTHVYGRMARLCDAGRRASRLDRMSQFFESMDIGGRTISVLRDIGEELLTNAFYNAPVAAGFFSRPVSRSEEIIVTADRGCDISYGATPDGLAFVRVRDSFGSLTRRRIVEVLRRCAATGAEVQIDESMGGAGLGLWRIFSAATFVAVAIDPGRSTDFVVGVQRRRRTMSMVPGGGTRPYAVHLYFNYFNQEATREPPSWEKRFPAYDAEQEVSATLQLT